MESVLLYRPTHLQLMDLPPALVRNGEEEHTLKFSICPESLNSSRWRYFINKDVSKKDMNHLGHGLEIHWQIMHGVRNSSWFRPQHGELKTHYMGHIRLDVVKTECNTESICAITINLLLTFIFLFIHHPAE